MTAVVVGIGLSSKATSEEVSTLLDEALRQEGRTRDEVVAIATRDAFGSDPRLVGLAPEIHGLPDDALVAASPPPARRFGLPSRVAETAARLVAAGLAPGQPRMLGATSRSAHATVALVQVTPGPTRVTDEHRP